MEDSGKSWRSQLSFIASMLLHAGAIALIALGPSLLNERPNTPVGGQKLDVTVNETAAPPAPAVAAPPAPVVAPVPVAKPVVAKQAIVKKTRIAKAHATPIAAAKVASAKTVKSQDITPQTPIAAQNSETVVDSQAEVAAEDASKIESPPETPEEAPKAEAAAVAPVAEPAEKDEKPAAAAAEAPAPVAEAAPAPAPVAPAAPVAPPAAVAPAAPAGNPASTAVVAGGMGHEVNVTQNYLGLRQAPGNKAPVYTRDMRLNQLQGDGQLVYFVDKNGAVNDIQLTKSTGHPELDQAAIDAFSKYKFVPGQEGYTVHNFQFSLKGPATSDTSRLRTSMK